MPSAARTRDIVWASAPRGRTACQAACPGPAVDSRDHGHWRFAHPAGRPVDRPKDQGVRRVAGHVVIGARAALVTISDRIPNGGSPRPGAKCSSSALLNLLQRPAPLDEPAAWIGTRRLPDRAEFSPAAELWCPNQCFERPIIVQACLLHRHALHVLGAVGDAAHRIVREVPALLHEVVLQAGQ